MSEDAKLPPFYLAYAHEALACAHSALGDSESACGHVAAGLASAAAVDEEDDRAVVEADLRELERNPESGGEA